MAKSSHKTLVWGIPTRAFHWFLAISFTTAYVLSDFEQFQSFHFAFGALAGGLLSGRVIWGLIGPRYSRFSDFPISFNKIIAFTKSIKNSAHIGHNPLASLVMLGIILIGLATAISGYLVYKYENQSLTSNLPFNSDFAEESHEILANLFLMLVIIHLAGIAFDAFMHKKDSAIFSIFTGQKPGIAPSASLNGFQKAFAVVWFVIAFYLFIQALNLPVTEQQDKHEKAKYDQESD